MIPIFYPVDYVFYDSKHNFHGKDPKLQSSSLSREKFEPDNDDLYGSDDETGKIDRTIIRKKVSYSSNKSFRVTIFGRIQDGKDIAVHVFGWQPYFYVQVPENTEATDYYGKIIEECNRTYMSKSGERPVYYIKNYYKFQFAVSIVDAMDFSEFKNYQKYKFIKFTFKRLAARTAYYWLFRRESFKIDGAALKIFEYNIPIERRFFDDSGYSPAMWLQANNYYNIDKNERITLTDYEIYVNLPGDIIKSKDHLLTPPKLLVCSFDIETANYVSKKKSSEPGIDPIKIVSLSYKCGEIFTRYVIIEGDSSPVEGINVIKTSNQAELIEAIRDNLCKMRPDVMISYNGDDFDWKYIFMTAPNKHRLLTLTKFRYKFSKYVERKMSSNNMGVITKKFIDSSGIINIDVYRFIEKLNITEIKNNKLDTVSKHLLCKKKKIIKNVAETYNAAINAMNSGKIDEFPIEEIRDYARGLAKKTKDPMEFGFELIKFIYEYSKQYKDEDFDNMKGKVSYDVMWDQFAGMKNEKPGQWSSRSLAEMHDLIKYCVQDCDLLHKILEKCQIIYYYIAFSLVAGLTIKTILSRGIGVQVLSCASGFIRDHGYLKLDEPPIVDELKAMYERYHNEQKKIREKDFLKLGDERFRVRTSKEFRDSRRSKGGDCKCTKEGIFTNVMGLDVASMYPSNQITYNLSHEMEVISPKFMNLPGIHYETYKTETLTGKISEHIFVSDRANMHKNCKGVIPIVLEVLAAKRKEAKKNRDKQPYGGILYAYYDSLQLAYKVMMNSFYGCENSDISQMSRRSIGSITTYVGRIYINDVLDHIQKTFKDLGIELRYRDTDSNFVNCTNNANRTYDEYVKIGLSIEKEINDYSKANGRFEMKIVFEKLWSIIVFNGKKKNYYGYYTEKILDDHGKPVPYAVDNFKFYTRGGPDKQRSATEFSSFCGDVLRSFSILGEPKENYKRIFKFLITATILAFREKIPVQYFLKSGRFKPPYKKPNGLPHIVAALKYNLYKGVPYKDMKDFMEHTDKSVIATNERIFYIYRYTPLEYGTRGGLHESKKCDIVEPYIEGAQLNFKLDYKTYIENVLRCHEHLIIPAFRQELANDKMEIVDIYVFLVTNYGGGTSS